MQMYYIIIIIITVCYICHHEMAVFRCCVARQANIYEIIYNTSHLLYRYIAQSVFCLRKGLKKVFFFFKS